MTDMPPPPPNMGPPPGYVAYGGPGAVQGTFQRIGGLTKWLVGLLVVSLVVQLVSLLVQFTLRDSATKFINNPSSLNFDDKLGLYLAVVAIAGIASVAQIVILIIWTFRLAKNGRVMGRQPQAFSPGATIAVNILGGCTLGILNFFMWRELWKAADPDTAMGDPSWKQRAVTPLLTVYLVLTLATIAASLSLGFAGAVGPVRTAGSSTDLAKNISDKLPFIALGGVLTLAAAAVFIVFVRQLAARHMQATHESDLG
ncbi:MAG TPA: hypothetical protein PK020_07860 [Ilumatobacteraceae bacterium]|nr:hypothetical protein [Ilumatobacteraceae bacterium]HRB03820.1 hypothetical protein [Ilumatobacteraceae bacterium]